MRVEAIIQANIEYDWSVGQWGQKLSETAISNTTSIYACKTHVLYVAKYSNLRKLTCKISRKDFDGRAYNLVGRGFSGKIAVADLAAFVNESN